MLFVGHEREYVFHVWAEVGRKEIDGEVEVGWYDGGGDET